MSTKKRTFIEFNISGDLETEFVRDIAKRPPMKLFPLPCLPLEILLPSRGYTGIEESRKTEKNADDKIARGTSSRVLNLVRHDIPLFLLTAGGNFYYRWAIRRFLDRKAEAGGGGRRWCPRQTF